MSSNKDSQRIARKLYKMCDVKGELSKKVALQIIRKILNDKPRNFQKIIYYFKANIKRYLDNNLAVVEYVNELDKDLKKSLENLLNKNRDKKINIEYRLNPDLIAGFKVKLGCDVWDCSISARLKNLENQLLLNT